MKIPKSRILVYDDCMNLIEVADNLTIVSRRYLMSINTVRNRLIDGQMYRNRYFRFENPDGEIYNTGRRPTPVIMFKGSGCETYGSLTEASEVTGLSERVIRKRIEDGEETNGMTFDFGWLS